MRIELTQNLVELLEIRGRLWEILFGEYRYNENHDEKGRFTFGSSGSGSSKKSVDISEKLGYTERAEAAKNMSPYEVKVVSGAILTDFPYLEPDGYRNHYEYGDFHYVFKVRYSGSYDFLEKWAIDKSKR